MKLYGDGLEALQPCGRKQHPALRQKSRNLRSGALTGTGQARARASALDPDERNVSALVRSGLICYIERRRFGARPRGPRSSAVVAALGTSPAWTANWTN